MNETIITAGQRFIHAYNTIDDVLRSRSKTGEERGDFSHLVRSSKDLSPQQKEILASLAKLRNVIVHTKFDRSGNPIAEPREDAVLEMEHQAEVLVNPPKVLGHLKNPKPRLYLESDSITDFFREAVIQNSFSQAPVQMKNGEIQLITTNAVARWVASSYDANGGEGAMLLESSILDVLIHSEDSDRPQVRAKNFRVIDAWKQFSGDIGSPPAAIIITETGRPGEIPLTMCVADDLPRLLKLLVRRTDFQSF